MPMAHLVRSRSRARAGTPASMMRPNYGLQAAGSRRQRSRAGPWRAGPRRHTRSICGIDGPARLVFSLMVFRALEGGGMLFRKRWIAVLATVMIGAGTAVAVGSFMQTASAQPTEAGKEVSATPVAPPPVAESSKEVVDNPYGLDALWKGGD